MDVKCRSELAQKNLRSIPWYLPGVCTTACMFFSCSCWMRSALALLSFSRQRTLCTYWLFKNFRSEVSWSSFLMWVLSSETRPGCVELSGVSGSQRWESVGAELLWQPTSGDTILVLLQLQQLEVQLIVLPHHPGIVCPVGLQKSIHVPAFLFAFTRWQFGIAQALSRVDQVTVRQGKISLKYQLRLWDVGKGSADGLWGFTWIASPPVAVTLFPVAVCSPADPVASSSWRTSSLRCCSWLRCDTGATAQHSSVHMD